MYKFKFFVIIIALGVLAACTKKTQSKPQIIPVTWQEKIDTLANEEVQNTGLPSLQIAIAYQENLIFENAYGQANIKTKTPATTKTQYRTASISKWFTGTATMKLVEQEKIKLDEPIQTYCPQYPEKKWSVTTRQLLSHTAGVRHYANYNAMREGAKTEAEKAKIESWIEKARAGHNQRFTDVLTPLYSFKDDPLQFEPGMGWGYSSFGYRVLACVMRGAADQPYRNLVQGLIFDPAGMGNTQDDDLAATIPNRATLYALTQGRQLKPAVHRDVSENLPAGGHLSTASDLVMFAQAYDSGKLVSPKSVAIMSSLPKAKNGEILQVGYGHGVDFMGAFPGSLGHGGRQAGTSTLLVLLPKRDISIAVMTNASGWNDTNQFTQKILDIITPVLVETPQN